MSNSLTILNNIDTPVSFHMKACSIPLLSEEEEYELLTECKTHEESSVEFRVSAQKIIYHYLRHISKIALKLYDSIQSFKEIVSEGMFGLLDAIKHFDLSKKVRFISYASWWVKYRISDWLEKKSVVKNCNDVISLNAPVGCSEDSDDTFTVEDTIPSNDTSIEDIEERDFEQGCTNILSDAFSCLSEREIQIVNRYNKGESLQEISETYNISRERVRQINNRAIEKLKEYLNSKNIQSISDI